MNFFWLMLFYVVVLYLFRYFCLNRRREKLIERIPGPKPIPIIGNMLLFNVPRQKLLSTFADLKGDFGNVFKTLHGSRPVVHLFAPSDIEVVLGASNHHTEKGRAYDFLLPWLGRGLLTSYGEKWYRHRKLISPTFHFKVLEGFLDVFNESSCTLVQKLRRRANYGLFFNICPDVTLCALDIICETAMGTKIKAQEIESSTYVTATLKVSELITDRQFTLWLHPDYIFFNTQKGREFLKNVAVLHEFTEKVIRDRKSQRKQAVFRDEGGESDLGVKKRLAFLDLLLDSADLTRVPLTDLEVREEVDTFMFEGHDTTTMAISWTLLLLGNHREIQAAVRSELREIFQDEGRHATLRDLGEMRQLERAIKEALRLFPSVPMITRVTDRPLQLGSFTVPEQTNIAIHIYNMHRSAEVFPNPLRFDPDRFLPEEVQSRHPYAYIPFSAGQRNCIGQKFAMYEEKVVLSWILRNFEVVAQHTVDQVSASHEVVCRPNNNQILIKLIPLYRV